MSSSTRDASTGFSSQRAEAVSAQEMGMGIIGPAGAPLSGKAVKQPKQTENPTIAEDALRAFISIEHASHRRG